MLNVELNNMTLTIFIDANGEMEINDIYKKFEDVEKSEECSTLKLSGSFINITHQKDLLKLLQKIPKTISTLILTNNFFFINSELNTSPAADLIDKVCGAIPQHIITLKLPDNRLELVSRQKLTQSLSRLHCLELDLSLNNLSLKDFPKLAQRSTKIIISGTPIDPIDEMSFDEVFEYECHGMSM